MIGLRYLIVVALSLCVLTAQKSCLAQTSAWAGLDGQQSYSSTQYSGEFGFAHGWARPGFARGLSFSVRAERMSLSSATGLSRHDARLYGATFNLSIGRHSAWSVGNVETSGRRSAIEVDGFARPTEAGATASGWHWKALRAWSESSQR